MDPVDQGEFLVDSHLVTQHTRVTFSVVEPSKIIFYYILLAKLRSCT